MYQYLLNQDPVVAETFLNTHVMAAHVTPYGACAHDFSKNPCPKHLKCFDNCGIMDNNQSSTTMSVMTTEMVEEGQDSIIEEKKKCDEKL